MCGAIVDRKDVIPSAICQLGGQIDQLGLAVDPKYADDGLNRRGAGDWYAGLCALTYIKRV